MVLALATGCCRNLENAVTLKGWLCENNIFRRKRSAFPGKSLVMGFSVKKQL